MRILSFHIRAFNDYLGWNDKDKATFKKINIIIKDILRNPFAGIGKPEQLK